MPSQVSRQSSLPAGPPQALAFLYQQQKFGPIPKAPPHAFPPSSSLSADFSKHSQVIAKLFLRTLFKKAFSGTERMSTLYI